MFKVYFFFILHLGLESAPGSPSIHYCYCYQQSTYLYQFFNFVFITSIVFFKILVVVMDYISKSNIYVITDIYLFHSGYNFSGISINVRFLPDRSFKMVNLSSVIAPG